MNVREMGIHEMLRSLADLLAEENTAHDPILLEFIANILAAQAEYIRAKAERLRKLS